MSDPSGAARPSRSTDTRARLIHASAALVAEEGWRGVTTRSVAARAGVNNALVHYHFGSIDALLVAAVSEAFAAEIGAGMELVLAPEDPAEGLAAFGRWLADRSDDVATDRILLEGMSLATRRDDVRAVFAPSFAAFRASLTDRLAVLGFAEPGPLASALAAMLDGIAIHRLLDPDLDVAAALEAVARLLADAHDG
ncbi:MAG: TetR/AcrR family transcriptional regulator [Actinomycetota bacterium]|nr:TetR/AcrR family transcriptional regulator [Actinomycetota bacterium]